MKQMVKTIGEGTFWLSFSSVLLKFVSLASVLFTLSRLDIYEYGLVQLTYSSLGLFGIFALPGLGVMVLADMGVAKSKDDTGEMKEIFSNYFKIQIVLGIVAWAILFFGSSFIAQYYKGQIGLLLKIISFSFLFSPFRSMCSLLFSINFKFFYQSMYTLIEESLKAIFIFSAFFIFKMRADGVIFAVVLSQATVLLFFLPQFFKLQAGFIHSQSKNIGKFWHILYRHGKWAVSYNYIHNVAQNVRLFLVHFFVGTEAVGIFSVAQGLFSNLSSFFPLNQAVAPALSQYRSDRKSFFRLVYKSVKYQVIGFACIGFISWFAVPPFIMFFFPKYAGSLPLFKIMVFSLIPAGYATITTVFCVFKLQKSLLFFEIIRMVSIVVLLPILTFFFGLKGLALETVLTVCFVVWVRNRMLSKKIPEFNFSLRYILSVDEYDKIIFGRFKGYVMNKLKFFGI